MVREIPLTQGKVALVDDEDYEWLSAHRWCTECTTSTYYAIRRVTVDGRQRRVSMHRTLLSVPPGLMPDHIDGDGLNNTRSNLRPATKSQNNVNQRLQRNNTSGYRGVSWSRSDKRWRAYIRKNRVLIHLGNFLTPERAALAYNVAAVELFGEFARLNDVRGDV